MVQRKNILFYTLNLFSIKFRQRSEQVDRGTGLVRIAQELRVQLLIPRQCQTAPSSVVVLQEVKKKICLNNFRGKFRGKLDYTQQIVERLVDHLDVLDGELGDAAEPVLVGADDAVVVQVDHLKVGVDEELHRLREVLVASADAALLHRLLELLGGDLAVLQKVLET